MKIVAFRHTKISYIFWQILTSAMKYGRPWISVNRLVY